MAPMTQAEEAEGGTWLLHPRVRNNSIHHNIFSVKKITELCILTPKGGPVHLSDHYYSPTRGPKEDRNWSPRVDGYELMVGVLLGCAKSISLRFAAHMFLVLSAPWSRKTSKLSLQHRRRY